MPRLASILVSILSLIGGALGCTGGDGIDAGSSAEVAGLSGSLGVISIERGVDELTPELISPGGEIGAAFARYRGVEGSAVLELLGRVRAAADLDTCAQLETDSVGIADPLAEVDLLDAGALSMAVAGDEVTIGARTFPELGSLVSGMFYAEDSPLPLSRADIDEYRITASGGPELPSFEVVAVGPPGVTDWTLDRVADSESMVLRRGQETNVSWSAGDLRDRIELDIMAGATAITCVMRDDGFFRLPADVTTMLEADPDARMVVRRTRAQAFDASGIDVAWVSLSTTTDLGLAVE